MSYPGIYKARCISNGGSSVDLYIPQLFGDVAVTTSTFTGAQPSPGTDGWVAFEGGDASYPVWISAAAGSGAASPGSSGAAGGVLSGTYPAPGFAVDMATQAELDTQMSGVVLKSTLTTKGDMYVASGAGTVVRLPVTTPGYNLVADPTQTVGVKWAPATTAAMTTAGDLLTYSAVSALPMDPTGNYALTLDGTAVSGANATLLASAAGGSVSFSNSGPFRLIALFTAATDISAHFVAGLPGFPNPLALEYSTNTTTGLDGTWTTAQTNYTNKTHAQYPASVEFVAWTGVKGVRWNTTNVSGNLTDVKFWTGPVAGPIRLGIGSSTQALLVVGGTPAWTTLRSAHISDLVTPIDLSDAVYSDTFTRADSTTTLGSPWTANDGTFGITTNKAYVATGGTAANIATIDTASARHRVSALVSAGTGAAQGLVARYVDANNYVIMQASFSFSTWNLYKRVGGTTTFVGNCGSPISATNAVVTLTAAGTTFTMTVDGGSSSTYTISDAGLQTGTKAGLFSVNTLTGTAYTWDNLSIKSLAITNTDISATAGIALSKLTTIANNTVVGNVSGSTAAPAALTASQTLTVLGLTGVTFVPTYAALAALTPTRGMHAWVDESGYELVYYGATTGWLPPWNQPWGLWATATSTTNTLGIGTSLSGNLVVTSSVYCPPNRNLHITGKAWFANPTVTATGITVRLFTTRNGSQMGGDRARGRIIDAGTAPTGVVAMTLHVDAMESGSTGNCTFGLAAATNTGNVDVLSATVNTVINVIDEGPLGGWAPSV